jgi:ferredoxin
MSEARAHDNCCHYTHEFGTSCVLPDPLVLIEDFRRADRPEARVAVEGLTVEMLAKAICEAAHPAPSSEPPWSPCPSHEVLARKAFANLPAPRPSEPDRTAALVEERHAALGHPPQGSRIACGCVAAVSAALRRADRPEARVATAADGICDCGAAHRWDVDRQEFVPTHTTAPRPSEPDRTAALVEVANLLRRHTHNETSVISHRCGNVNDCLLCRALVKAGVLTLDDIGSTTREAILAPTPDEAP